MKSGPRLEPSRLVPAFSYCANHSRSGRTSNRDKIAIFLATTLLLLGGLIACSKTKPELNVFIWNDYLNREIVADFERTFNCRVRIDLYDDNDLMIAKLAHGAAPYDIVAPSTFYIPAMVQRGLLAPLRLENIPNFANLDPEFIHTEFDPENKHTVPFLWGTDGIYMRKPATPFDRSWSLFLDPAKQPGPFLLLEDSRSCIDMVMLSKGHGGNCTDPKLLAEASDLLIDVKKRSRGFATGIAGRDRVLAREATMVIAYSNDALRGTKEDPDTIFFHPREGAGKWMDNLAIPTHAPHRDLAEKFINYLLDAKVGAKIAEFSCGATPNKAAMEFLKPADRTNTAIYPPPEVRQKLIYAKDLGEKQKLYDEIWTQIKSK